jgi:5'-methylthioadenosine phosphorylase
MFKILGCDIVGKTGLPEAVLAREIEICYASFFYVTNMASGLMGQKNVEEASEEKRKVIPIVRQVLKEVIPKISARRNCICSHALEGARL